MDKILFWVSMGWVLILQTGCWDWKPFGGNLSDPEYKLWAKPGVSDLELKKALLECGFPILEGIDPVKNSNNDIALMDRCMEKDGFRSLHRWTPCKIKDNRPPACDLPESQVPDRSAERRLNSKHCQEVRKLYPEQKFCTQP